MYVDLSMIVSGVRALGQQFTSWTYITTKPCKKVVSGVNPWPQLRADLIFVAWTARDK